MRGSWGLMARVLGQMRPSTDPLSGPNGPRQRAHFGLIAAKRPQRTATAPEILLVGGPTRTAMGRQRSVGLLAEIGTASQRAPPRRIGGRDVKARSVPGRLESSGDKIGCGPTQPQSSCPQPPGRYGAGKACPAALPDPCARHCCGHGVTKEVRPARSQYKVESCPKRCPRQ